MGLLSRSSSSFLESQTKLWDSIRSTQNEREKLLPNNNTKIDTRINNSSQIMIGQNTDMYSSNIYNKKIVLMKILYNGTINIHRKLLTMFPFIKRK